MKIKILIVASLVLFFLLFFIFILKDLPSPTKLGSTSLPQSSQILARDNRLLYTIYDLRDQTFVPLSDIPKHLQQATIAIEDKDFYRHGAIDFRGILRAFVSIIFYQQVQGGSTITQQLVKNSLLTPERTVTRKIKEIVLAFATELLYSKDKILEMYFNQSPYGGPAWGAQAASQRYFGKNVKELSLSEAALLAGLPEAPTVYSPFGAHPELAKKRQEEILSRMYEQGYITKVEKEKAIRQPLKFKKLSNTIKAPHFVLYIKEQLTQKYGKEMVEQGGLIVKTSLNLDIQEFAQQAVASEVAKLESYHVTNGAVLITNPATGEILAMVGSRDYFDTEIDGNVNVTLAYRQPGSSIKPINYAVGLIHGYTAATAFVDQPICFPNPTGKPYCPVNYDGKWHGVIQMRQALGNSINIPAVKMLKLNGLSAMIATASAMGITTFTNPSRYGLSLTLGGGEVTMIDMAESFGVFANQGHHISLHPILKVTNQNGKILQEYTPLRSPLFAKKVLPKGVAFIISDILSDNSARELAFGSNSKLRIPKHYVAVKTGTTNDYRDNWTIGYTPLFLTAVWVGNNNNSPMSGLVSGVTGAAPIWNTIMTHLLENQKPQPFPKPDSVISKIVCSTSGLLAPPDGTADRCPTRLEYFLKGTEPTKGDMGRQKVWIDKTTNDLAKPNQTDNVEERGEVVVKDPTGEQYCVSCPRPSI